MSDGEPRQSMVVMPWEQGPLRKRLIWKLYFWLGTEIDDRERGGWCACRWYGEQLHPDTICEYHRRHVKSDPRVDAA
jgi:hypothetical protein